MITGTTRFIIRPRREFFFLRQRSNTIRPRENEYIFIIL